MTTPFDWQQFVVARNIEYIDAGANVAAGHIAIHCPFCGHDDPSFHMGLSLTSSYWGCWRDSTHRGLNPVRLIAALLRCSKAEAASYVEAAEPAPVAIDLTQVLADIDEIETKKHFDRKLEMPTSFIPLRTSCKSQYSKFVDYIRRRGFDDVDDVASLYDIRACLDGKFSYRVIFPFFMYGECIGWTGRAIVKSTIRYRTEPKGSTNADYVFNSDNAREGGDTLVVVEGPIDAVKVDYFGREWNARAVALQTSSLTPARANEIAKLSAKFKRVMLLFDDDAFYRAFGDAKPLLASIRCPIELKSPEEVQAHDPGEMNPKQIREILGM